MFLVLLKGWARKHNNGECRTQISCLRPFKCICKLRVETEHHSVVRLAFILGAQGDVESQGSHGVDPASAFVVLGVSGGLSRGTDLRVQDLQGSAVALSGARFPPALRSAEALFWGSLSLGLTVLSSLMTRRGFSEITGLRL